MDALTQNVYIDKQRLAGGIWNGVHGVCVMRR